MNFWKETFLKSYKPDRQNTLSWVILLVGVSQKVQYN